MTKNANLLIMESDFTTKSDTTYIQHIWVLSKKNRIQTFSFYYMNYHGKYKILFRKETRNLSKVKKKPQTFPSQQNFVLPMRISTAKGAVLVVSSDFFYMRFCSQGRFPSKWDERVKCAFWDTVGSIKNFFLLYFVSFRQKKVLNF